jgi:uracil-DNA glycosylase
LPNGKWLVATYHPAYLLRQSKDEPALFDEFAGHLRAARLLLGSDGA